MVKKSKCERKKKFSNEKTNLFDLRFSKIKRKIITKRNNDNKSDIYKSRKRDNDLRQNKLLNEYKNRNKTGSIKIKKKLNESSTDLFENENVNSQFINRKRKSNSEYMAKLFEKKHLIQLEKDKLDDLKEELDFKWKELKDEIFPSNTQINYKTNKIDKFDLILSDLLINDGKKCIPGSLLRSDFKSQSLNKNTLQSYIITFEKLIDELKTNTDYNKVKSILEKLLNYKKINSNMYDYLKLALIELDCNSNVLNAISILSLSSSITSFKNLIFFKLAEFFKVSNYNSVENIIDLIIYCKFFLKVTNKLYFPEIIIILQNILILFLKKNNYDKLFLPNYKLNKIDDRSFLHFDPNVEHDLENYCLSLEFYSSKNFNTLSKEMKNNLILKDVLNLILTLNERYLDFEASNLPFYFINKILSNLISDYPNMNISITNILSTYSDKPMKGLKMPKQKPKILPMLEPKFDFEDSTPKQIEPKTIEKILNKKLKKEMKSAQREIKKDAAFLNTIKLKETLEKDKIRKEKVKQLISEINLDRSLFKK